MIFLPSSSILTTKAQEDIRQIDFLALKLAGYRGAVFDKDNCLVLAKCIFRARFMAHNPEQTLPHRDTIIPELQVHVLFLPFDGDINIDMFRNHGKYALKLSEKATFSL